VFEVVEHADLSHFNTLALPCVAKRLVYVESLDDLQKAYAHFDLTPNNSLIMGGGSNLVLPDYLDLSVIHLKNNGIHFESRPSGDVFVDVDAGVVWDELVSETVKNGLHGLENLSLIPGSVGAAPVQNIGAYGVELADVLESVTVFNSHLMKLETLLNKDCQFAYRDSIFKRNPGKFCILNIRLHLARTKPFSLNYGELKSLVGQTDLNVADVREKVISVRSAKLPSPKVLPNAGSFFKNPIVTFAVATNLKSKFPGLVSYPVGQNEMKLAAGWLIDQAGWKGYRDAAVGVHSNQALVLINHNKATQNELLCLAQKIQNSIRDMFGVSLDVEPIVVPSGSL